MSDDALRAPFPYFGGKRSVVDAIWERLGTPKQYIEPFCGSAAVLLASPHVAPLEVVNDLNGFIANFWRATKHDADAVASWADYPVSHIDLGARHAWLGDQRMRLGDTLQDPEWPGDAQVAGWWLWGQCAWIGSGWCEWAGDAGRGVQARGQIPHASSAGMGVLARCGDGDVGMVTSGGRTALDWLRRLQARLERVRVTHGDWHRCLNHHYGGDNTAVFLDPPYRAYEKLYGSFTPTADAVATWAGQNGNLRIAICGHVDDYDLPGWELVPWERGSNTYGGDKTKSLEAIWFSPACRGAVADAPPLRPSQQHGPLFALLDE